VATPNENRRAWSPLGLALQNLTKSMHSGLRSHCSSNRDNKVLQGLLGVTTVSVYSILPHVYYIVVGAWRPGENSVSGLDAEREKDRDVELSSGHDECFTIWAREICSSTTAGGESVWEKQQNFGQLANDDGYRTTSFSHGRFMLIRLLDWALLQRRKHFRLMTTLECIVAVLEAAQQAQKGQWLSISHAHNSQS
jgi:hypothetical protein